MENKTKLLIAIGAAVTASCQACLQTAISQALKAGAKNTEISQAMAIGRVVRRGTIGKMDRFASSLIGKNITDNSDDCPFGSTEEDMKSWVDQNGQCDCNQTKQEATT